MRVILLHPHDPTETHLGGIGTFLNTFVKYAPEDLEVSLIGITRDPERHPVGRWQKLESGGKTFQFLPICHQRTIHRSRIPLSLRYTWALRRFRAFLDFQKAILEFHRIEPILALKKLSNPKALFIHGHMRDLYHPQTEVRWGKFPALYFWLEKGLIPANERVYLVREDAVPFYRERFPRINDRFSFLPSWVDEGIFHAAAEEERARWKKEWAREEELDPQSRILLFVGRFEGQKDPLLLLEAFSRLNGQVGPTVLVMVGTGTMEGSIRDFIHNRNLSTSVRIFGPKNQEEIARLMNIADCLCLSSAFEGMPRVALEALQCGLPVVSTKVGEAPRLIATNRLGRLVSDRTPQALSRALLDLLSQRPDREACQKQVAPFTARKVLGPVYQYYRDLSQRSFS